MRVMEGGVLNRITVSAIAAEAVRLQPFPGSAWRGVFAKNVKRLVCVLRHRPCGGCPLEGTCLYPRLFGPAAERSGEARPFILAPSPLPRGGRLVAGDRVTLRMSVLPSARTSKAYLKRALIEAVRQGPLRGRTPFEIESISEDDVCLDDHGQAEEPGRATRLAFLTPLRLRLRGDLVVPEALTPGMLVDATLRRARGLGISLPEELASASRAQARHLAFDAKRLRWLETWRYSSRQSTVMAFGGIVGEAELDLSSAPEVRRTLSIASILHLGKGASMGFGHIALGDAPNLETLPTA